MGMEPFVGASADAFAPLIASIPDPVEALRRAVAFKVGLAQKQAEIANTAAQAAEISQKLTRAQLFQQDLKSVQADPSAKNVSALIMKYPEYGEQVKGGWDVKDKAAKDADLTQLSEVYSAAAAGNWELAHKQAQDRIDAEKAAGTADAGDQAMLDQITAAASGDPVAQKNVLAALGTHIAAISGAEHFASVYGALKGGYTLQPGDVRLDDNGNMVAHSPFIKSADGDLYDWNKIVDAGGAPKAEALPNTPPAGDGGFDNAVAFTLKHEGGYNPRDLNGAPVNFGINQAANPGVDVKGLTADEAKGIYKTKYWDESGAANLPAVMQTPYFDTYVINPKRAQQFLKTSGGDPNKFMDLREAWLAGVAKKNPQYAKAYANRNADLRLTVNGADTSKPYYVGDSEAGTSGAPQPLLRGNDPGQYRTLTDTEVKTRQLDPAQQYQLNTKTGQVTGLGQKTGGDDVLGRYNIQPSETGPAVLAKLPASMASQVKALAEGRLPMPSSFALAKPYWQAMLQLTSQYDPSFDASSFPARKSAITAFTGMGKGAQVVSSVNRVANHLQLLWNESNKLAGPETGFGPLNTALAAAGQAFEPQDAKAYDTEVQFIAGELEKIARNSPGTVSGVDKIISNLSRKQSTETRQSAIRAAVGIISGAIDPLKDQYNSAFTNDSTRPRIPWVTPKAQQIYRDIGGVDTSLTGAGADTNAPASGESKPPPGATKTATGPNGEKAALVNGHWVRY